MFQQMNLVSKWLFFLTEETVVVVVVVVVEGDRGDSSPVAYVRTFLTLTGTPSTQEHVQGEGKG